MRIDITDPAGDRWEFDWDPVTGDPSGPDGWWVDHLLGLYAGLGALGTPNRPVDTHRSVPAMALFLMLQGFVPPDALCAPLAPARPPAVAASS